LHNMNIDDIFNNNGGKKEAKTYANENTGVLTNSKLKEFEICQYSYYLKYVKKCVPEKQTAAMRLGTAFHSFEADRKSVVVASRNTKAGKELAEEAEAKGKLVIPKAEGEKLNKCMSSMERQELYLKRENPEDCVDVPFKGIILRARPDEIRLDDNMFLDLKTCASFDKWKGSSRERYLKDMQFYYFVLKLKYEKKFDCRMQVVTTEEVSRTFFDTFDHTLLEEGYSATYQRILNFIEAKKEMDQGIFHPRCHIVRNGEVDKQASTNGYREYGMYCDSYAQCQFAKQLSPFLF